MGKMHLCSVTLRVFLKLVVLSPFRQTGLAELPSNRMPACSSMMLSLLALTPYGDPQAARSPEELLRHHAWPKF